MLVPPRLLEASAAFPADAYVVVLDRQAMTPELRTLAREGRLVLRILVLTDGTAGRVELARSSGIPAFDRAALEAARQWRFQPATRDGVAIDAWAIVPVRFVVP